MSERPKYMNRGGEVWERTEDGERELFAADAVTRLIDLERQLADRDAQLTEARTALEFYAGRIRPDGRGFEFNQEPMFRGDTAREALASIDAKGTL